MGKKKERKKNIKSTTKTKEHQRNPENPILSRESLFPPCSTLFHSDLSPLSPRDNLENPNRLIETDWYRILSEYLLLDPTISSPGSESLLRNPEISPALPSPHRSR